MLHVLKIIADQLFVDNSQAALYTKRGTTYYVDANGPSTGDSRSGKSWRKAFKTMSKALTTVASGDTIVFTGKIREQLITPVQVFDVTIRGLGNRPRHADDTPEGGEEAAATWTTPASGATTAALLKVLQQGWAFENILFAGPSDHACLWFFRDAGAADDERDASHAIVRGCRFASGQDGIWITETGGIRIEDNVFGSGVGGGMTGFDILGVAGAGIANPLQLDIRNNKFFGSANHVKFAGNNALVTGNFFDDGGTPTTTVVLNVDASANGAGNFVVSNYFQTSTANFNSPDVEGNATDVWALNVSKDSTSAGVGANTEWGKPA